jgi:hypothetical protein
VLASDVGDLHAHFALISVPLLKAYGFSPLQLAKACMSRLRNATDGLGRGAAAADAFSGSNSSDAPAGPCETDALLFNPLDEPGD